MMYKFRCDLKGHNSDVRCLAQLNDNVIISGSRDRTCRVWTSNGGTYDPGYILCGHSDFIASLCVIPSCELYPDGLIITGSNDHTICAYSPKLSDLLFTLIAHTDTVCCVNPAVTGSCGLLSSSWDFSVIMWDLVSRCVVFKITGNNYPIWSVIQMSCGTIVTASADKLLRAYSNKGELIRSYYGHSDVARYLYKVNDTIFLSCGNDGHVLRWNILSNSCDAAIDTVHHFLYSICHLSSKNITAYAGERGCIYVNSGAGSETIPVPCTSVWCITILSNGDVAAGCSDGVIRVYTSDPKRYANEVGMKSHSGEVQKFALSEYEEKKHEIRCPYLNDLLGPEKLNIAGKISNEVICVRKGFLAVMYSWSTDRWMELAKRRGTYQYDISNKKIHNGKAYDYLFPINIDDNQPNLILPLSLGEDILARVIQFMSEYNLSSHYSETIYNHIADSVKDDFIKAALLESSLQGIVADGSFLESLNVYFPKTAFICFEKGNVEQITGKLSELAKKCNLDISEEDVNILKSITNVTHKCSTSHCDVLFNTLNWPQEAIFPVLDTLRLAIRNESFHSYIFTSVNRINSLSSILLFHLQNDSFPINQLMALKVCCNIFSFEIGKKNILDEFSNVMSTLSNMTFPSNFSSSLQVAASSLLLNFIVAAERNPSIRSECLKCVSELLNKFSDKEAFFRAFVAIGNLVSYEGSFFISQSTINKLKSLEKENEIQGHSAQSCLDQLLQCFQD